jgi:Cysteine rich repeat
MFMRTLCVALALSCVAFAAQAGNMGTKDEQTACRADVRKFCAQIQKADNDKYHECLQSHFSELSQKCQQVLMNHQNQK